MYLAGIVTYNPEIERLKENINSIKEQVEKVLIVDNNSKNPTVIENLIKGNNKIELIKNKDNLGIAKALNQILFYANENNYDWFITLDQDSVCKRNIIQKYKKYINLENIAMISSKFEDTNLNDENNKETDNYKYINKCITSATFNNTEILTKLGGFDEKMFIDFVDYDMCQTIIENNYKIIECDFIGFKHSVGKSQYRKILWKRIVIYNESSFRTYYMIRNHLYYIKKHRKSINILKEYLSFYKIYFKIMVYEDNKKEKWKEIKRAKKDFRKMF